MADQPSPRHRFQFRLRSLFIAVTVFCVILNANLQPSRSRLLGHISSDDPMIRPGLWIIGHDYGWPWRYQTVGFKTDDMPVDPFDRFYSWALAGNVAVGIAITLAVIAAVRIIALARLAAKKLLQIN
jgi:hypothetical protein